MKLIFKGVLKGRLRVIMRKLGEFAQRNQGASEKNKKIKYLLTRRVPYDKIRKLT